MLNNVQRICVECNWVKNKRLRSIETDWKLLVFLAKSILNGQIQLMFLSQYAIKDSDSIREKPKQNSIGSDPK